MTVDISRKSFDPRRHTAWTTTMQGRVATDAPVNENQAQRDRRVRALLTDLAGRCGYPEILPNSFKIGISGGQLTIAPGRYYVDGHLADNFGAGAAEFDPVLSELRGPNPVLFSAQPFGTGGAPAPAAGTHIAYVDVWQRDVTFLEDDTILDPGIATDSFARRQTVWQVRTFGPVGAGTTCSTAAPAWDTFISPSRARLTTRANPAGAINDPCLLPPGALYRGIDNRTYRVEIHGFTGTGAPLIKFSRTNGSVATAILARPQADVLEVAQVAKDDFLRFNAGDWVEVTDEARLLAGQSGTMARVLSVDDPSNTITLENLLPAGALQLVGVGPAANQAVHPVLRRWDQTGEIRDENGVVLVDLDAPGATGLIPVPTNGTFVSLEDGVEAALTLAAGIGSAKVNDNWSFIARYADTSVEKLQAAPPQDYHHHFCRLAMVTAVVTAAGGVFTAVVEDCRDPLGGDCDCCCITVEVGDSIQDAINRLPVETGGCICLTAGVHHIQTALELTTSHVHIVGASRGAIVELDGDGTVLRVKDAHNVDIDMVGFRHRDGIDKQAIVEIIDCASVNLWRCSFAALVGRTSFGIAVKGSDDIAIRDCDFGALAFGVVTLGEGGLLTIADNVFALEGKELAGHTAIWAAKTTGVLRVTGNTIGGVLNGVIVNDDPADDTRRSFAAGSLIADNDVRLRYIEKQAANEIMRGIDSAADSCTIRGNRVNLAGRAALGIFVSGADLAVIENRVEVDGDHQGGFTAGIMIGATDDKTLQLTTGVSVTHNAVRGTMIGIFAGHASNLTIADNRVHDGVETSVMAMLFTQLDNATVRGNTIGRTRISVLAGGGSRLRLIGNHLAPAGAGIALLQEFAPTVEGNSIDQARSFGIVLAQTIGRTAVTGNRLRNCGYDGNFAGGIGALFVLGELAVCGNEIMDTGFVPDGAVNNVNNAKVVGIFGFLVLEALVSENLVSTTQPEARPDGLEDRALSMLGLWDISQGRNESVIGFPCTIIGNKFYGKGFSALVQLLEFQVSDLTFLRFERVFFTNNYCSHFGKRARTASVILTGSAGVVMGNQVKGEGSELPSIDMSHMVGTEVGNITTGDIVRDPNFPAPKALFNERF